MGEDRAAAPAGEAERGPGDCARPPAAAPEWARAAGALPLPRAQSREDLRPELDLVRSLGSGARILSAVDGGDGAAALGALPSLAGLDLFDPDPPVLALARLKLRLRERAELHERRALLGREPLPAEERAWRLRRELEALDLDPGLLGPPALLGERGLDGVGRREQIEAALRAHLDPAPWGVLLSLDDPEAQAPRFAALEAALAAACAEVLAPAALDAVAGSARERAALGLPTGEALRDRLRELFASLPARENPFLWQLLCGRDAPAGAEVWLGRKPGLARTEVQTIAAAPTEALARATAGAYRCVRLGALPAEIVPDELAALLEAALRALAPGGLLTLRALGELPLSEATPGGLVRDAGLSARLRAADRSVRPGRLVVLRAR
ncbi:MAG: hypothetical protein D6731_12190 [Planctomycetota bacterium]|nr:MAG: hypothetical protein D6731_12190 [Planctomycetota bacterium]